MVRLGPLPSSPALLPLGLPESLGSDTSADGFLFFLIQKIIAAKTRAAAAIKPTASPTAPPVPRPEPPFFDDTAPRLCELGGTVGVIVTVLTWPVMVSSEITGVGVHVALDEDESEVESGVGSGVGSAGYASEDEVFRSQRRINKPQLTLYDVLQIDPKQKKVSYGRNGNESNCLIYSHRVRSRRDNLHQGEVKSC